MNDVTWTLLHRLMILLPYSIRRDSSSEGIGGEGASYQKETLFPN